MPFLLIDLEQVIFREHRTITTIEALSTSGINHDQVRTLREEVYDLMVKEDCLWHQRSRVEWLKAGDLNTNYFHSQANQRNRRNYISKLVLDDGLMIEEEQQIGKALTDHFNKLF